MQNKIPRYQDYVKNKHNDASGTVIAVYERNDQTYCDVRSDDGRIYYETLASNWKTVRTEDELV